MALDTTSPFEGQSVLVLEDEPFIAMDIARIVEDAGAKNVDIFMRLETTPVDDLTSYDAAVIDMDLHGQSSLAIAQQLRECAIPFIIVTGGSKRNTRDASLAGIPRVDKPFDEQALIKTLCDESRRLKRRQS